MYILCRAVDRAVEIYLVEIYPIEVHLIGKHAIEVLYQDYPKIAAILITKKNMN